MSKSLRLTSLENWFMKLVQQKLSGTQNYSELMRLGADALNLVKDMETERVILYKLLSQAYIGLATADPSSEEWKAKQELFLKTVAPYVEFSVEKPDVTNH